jgi:hypothetical protein
LAAIRRAAGSRLPNLGTNRAPEPFILSDVSAAEYRNWAEDYFKWAREAPDANVRVAYVKMAQLWLECAYQIEFKSVNIPARVKARR